MQTSRRHFTAGLAAAATLSPVARVFSQATPDSTVQLTDLEPQLLAVMDELSVPGAAIAYLPPDSSEPEFLELGVADVLSGEPISADMHFRIAQVTSTFVSTVVLQLVDEGSISLDDTIASVLPALELANVEVATVRNLLAMRSGVPEFWDNPDYFAEYWHDFRDFTKSFDFWEWVPRIADYPARAEPNTMYSDGFIDYLILGEIIQEVTGESWIANVQARILDPLGLSNTVYPSGPEMPEPYAVGYGNWEPGFTAEDLDLDPTAPTPEMLNEKGIHELRLFNPIIHGPAGGMVSTVKDQLVWVQALTGGDLLSPETHAERFNKQPRYEGDTGGYGLGLTHRRDGGNFWGHYGGVPGYQAMVLSDLDSDSHLVILSNAEPVYGFTGAPHHLSLFIFP